MRIQEFVNDFLPLLGRKIVRILLINQEVVEEFL